MRDAFLDIRLRDLHFFERLAALGSLTAVAQELRLPKATVSRWLTELERVGAIASPGRTTHAPVLTPQGEELAKRARSLLGQADAARMALLSDAPTGVLRVSVPVPLGRMLAGP
ncbi:MAG: LysR family transcriptional regulator [Polyangiales bacterium]